MRMVLAVEISRIATSEEKLNTLVKKLKEKEPNAKVKIHLAKNYPIQFIVSTLFDWLYL